MYGYEAASDEINGWDLSASNETDLFSIDDIEKMLLTDDADVSNLEELPAELPDDFFSDLIFDSPLQSGDVADGEKNWTSISNSNSNSSSAVEEGDDVAVEVDGEDPVLKKQRRQLRNRDAAVRSRERKKMYVKDLEMKSRYFEGECRRLGILLQCCSAENQALRLSLQNAKPFDASMTKQESAVLVLESLLLGSLLWFLGIMCLFNLPQPENVVDKVQGSPVLLEKPVNHDEIFSIRMSQLFFMSRKCKGSRSRMKETKISLPVDFLMIRSFYPL